MNRPPRKGPRYLIIAGVAALVLGVVAFIGGFVMLGSNFLGMFEQATDPEGALRASTAVPGSTTVNLEPGRYQVVALGPNLVTKSGSASSPGGYRLDRGPFADPDVTVTSPAGSAVVLEPPQIERLASLPSLDQVGFAEFTAAEAGSYTVDVAGAPGQVLKVGVAEAKSIGEEASPWLASSGVIMLGGAGLALGVILTVAGIIWRVVGRASGPPATPGGPGFPGQPWQV